MPGTTVLLTLDGIGITEKTAYNAFIEAKTPNIDRLMYEYPCVRGLSAGMAVGLPNGQSGNAKAGYENIGAGRIVYQQITRINKEIASGAFFQNKALLDTVSYCRSNDSSLHIVGMLSDGGVHSHTDHIVALLKLAADNSFGKVYVHCFTDGRDTGSGLKYIERLQTKMRELGVGEIATVSGRFYAMDRDNNYDRIKLTYLAMTQGEGNKAANAAEAVQAAYDNGETDEFIKPTVIVNGGVPVGAVNDMDAVIFINIRSDRSRELTRAFCEDEFRMFKRDYRPDIRFVCFDDPDPSIENKVVAFESQSVENTLGEYLSLLGLRQLRLTESENQSNVNVFFDCGVREPFDGVDRLSVRSAKVKEPGTIKPSMSAPAICDKLTEVIRDSRYDFVLCNISNADVLGHTCDMDIAVKAMEELDKCVGRIVNAVFESGAVLFICSTHGKIEQLRDYETGEPYKCHTSNPVPFILVNYTYDVRLREAGCLADVAPTILEIMGIPQPKEMTGKSLINRE
ncbi:MAG: 2,3-bisphosphoglycerate-independent phosphoglycerate mutase [Lachnospiraceae bacterium]|nr:2,3-bisphosphoglycerate-independent phosphoglycerate mutase [Lachnospiraceae bacterium]